jgi:hypothetical protein
MMNLKGRRSEKTIHNASVGESQAPTDTFLKVAGVQGAGESVIFTDTADHEKGAVLLKQ